MSRSFLSKILRVNLTRAMASAVRAGEREDFIAQDDHLPERSYGPTTSGALADGGVDREKLQEAIHTYYRMLGWDKDTGVRLPDKLHELDVSWAVAYLPRSSGLEPQRQ